MVAGVFVIVLLDPGDGILFVSFGHEGLGIAFEGKGFFFPHSTILHLHFTLS